MGRWIAYIWCAYTIVMFVALAVAPWTEWVETADAITAVMLTILSVFCIAVVTGFAVWLVFGED